MLEIVISESEKNVLTYSNLFKKNDIVSFSLLLTYGKIKNIEQSEYKRVLDVELNPKCIFNELIEKLMIMMELEYGILLVIVRELILIIFLLIIWVIRIKLYIAVMFIIKSIFL